MTLQGRRNTHTATTACLSSVGFVLPADGVVALAAKRDVMATVVESVVDRVRGKRNPQSVKSVKSAN
jgi:hypothetical protein